MYPMGRIFRIRLSPLHADPQRDLFTFVGTGLDQVRERDHSSMRTIEQARVITQGFQFPFYPIDIIGHDGKGYATGVGLSGIAINRLSSFRLTRSSPPYVPLSPFRM